MRKKELDLTGVEVRGDNIRITFQLRGQRCRESLGLAPTAPNLQYAARLRREIQEKIKYGSFVYADYFPDSERAGFNTTPARRLTFADLANDWLDLQVSLAKSTKKRSYEGALKGWISQLGAKPLPDITFHDLQKAIAARTWSSPKTLNNHLIPLRKVLRHAFVSGFIKSDPAAQLENAKYQRPEPDPLTVPEMELVLAHLSQHYDEQVWNYFEFAFMTGMRPSEQIALTWDDVDFNRRQVYVGKASVEGETKQATKTHRSRFVDLNSRALAVLQRQKRYTFLGSKTIFQNPVTNKAWSDEQRQRVTYWQPAFKALGMRQRDAYQTRHTFATTLLMAGVNPAYIAQQMGHANLKMLLERYGRWLPHANDTERKLADAAFAPVMPQRKPKTD